MGHPCTLAKGRKGGPRKPCRPPEDSHEFPCCKTVLEAEDHRRKVLRYALKPSARQPLLAYLVDRVDRVCWVPRVVRGGSPVYKQMPLLHLRLGGVNGLRNCGCAPGDELLVELRSVSLCAFPVYGLGSENPHYRDLKIPPLALQPLQDVGTPSDASRLLRCVCAAATTTVKAHYPLQ